MRHPFHWNANNQKSTREKGTLLRCYHKEQVYSDRKHYHLNYDKHTDITSLHLFGINEKGHH